MSGLAEDSMNETAGHKWAVRAAVLVLLLAFVAGGWWALGHLFSGKTSAKKTVTTVKLLPDTPPPPPPPKEPPKEQPKEQPKEIKIEQPKPQEAPQPPAEALKMEGAAGDGPSAFAAGTVNNEYKGGDVGTKIGGGGNRHQFNWYAGLIKSRIEDALAKDPQLASGKYKVMVNVWVKPDGRIERLELVGSSGEATTDERIKAVLNQMPPVSEAPPDDMPQPVKLRISARSVS